MKSGVFLGIGCAVVVHVGILLFGGALFLHDKKDEGTTQEVELVSEDDVAKEEKPEEKPVEATDELKTETEQAPDAAEMIKSLELAEAANTPKLEAASLSAIEAALSGQAGAGGDFAQSMDFTSGGRIGGTGKAGVMDAGLEDAFSLGEIDQKPRAIVQSAPAYPSSMRGKKVEGVVTVVFVVDASGKVIGPRVESSNNPVFDKPAVSAVKGWKFEPAVKGGQRVACKMRVPIRFQPS